MSQHQTDKELIARIQSIKMLDMMNAIEVLKGSVELDRELHILAENLTRCTKLIRLLTDLKSIRTKEYYKSKQFLYESINDERLNEMSLVRSSKDGYIKAALHEEMYQRDYVESKLVYYIGMKQDLTERINIYKKTRTISE